MHEVWWITLIKSAIVVNVVMLFFALTTWLERKLLGRLQNRYGPNRAGPKGLLVPIADLVKLIRKEAFAPMSAKEPLYIIAPVLSMFTALAAFSVIPWGPGWTVDGYYISGQVVNVPISLILIFALGSLGIYGFIIGGWASDSKFSMLGSMRTCAQLVSYEVSLALSVLGVVLMGQSLNLTHIVAKQETTMWFFIPQFVGLVVFLLGGIAETSRPPFDLPEADTHGKWKPPKNSVTQRPESTIMLMYSAAWKRPQRMPEYSVWYPATSSVSASGRSNGGRDVSAMPPNRKMTSPTNCGMKNQSVAACLSTMSTRLSDWPIITTPSTDSASDTS